MRTIYALVACAVVAGAAIGCGDDTSSGAGGSGGSSTNTGGTSNTGGTTVNTGGTTSNSMGGMAPNCDGLTGGTDDCSLCAEGSCCPELDACLNDANCGACVSGQGGTACDTDALVTALTGCLDTSCATECAPPPNECNPITNEGCDTAAGEACDFGQSLTCYPAPNDVALCGACDAAMGPFCQAGSTCALNNQCTKFCCTDADCGTGKCDLTLTGDVFGLCTLANDNMMPSCDAPAMAPSMGTCFTL